MVVLINVFISVIYLRKMVLEEANSSSFNLELMDDTQDSIDPSLISENCALFYERGEQGYICKVCDHQYA